MRFFLKVAALLGLTASTCAVNIPDTTDPNGILDVVGTTDRDHVSILFNTSCPGCFVGTSDGLELNLVIPKSHGECLGPNPILNGVPLDQRWRRNQARGRGHFPVHLLNGLGKRQMSISWTSVCAPGEGQVLSTRISLDGGPVKYATGFTVSFKQDGVPTVLRLSNTPTGLGSRRNQLEPWLHPSEDQRLRIGGQDTVHPSALDAEFAKLEDIKREMAILHAVMRKQEHNIIRMLKKDFKQCDGMQCMLQTAMQKAPDFAHLIAEHFSHESVRLNNNEQHSEIAFAESLGLAEPPLPLAQGVRPMRENPAPPASPWNPPPKGNRPHPPFEGDHPHPPFEGDHPPPPPNHGNRPHGPPGRHHHGPPPIFHRIRHGRHGILKAAIALLAGSFLMSLLFKAIRNHAPCFKDPRRRAERASRREERRTRCQYRRAAHRHRISSWWAAHKPRRSQAAGIADYDEKRTLILQQEGILEQVMQDEIRNLETAAELEEGLGRSHITRSAPQEMDGQSSSSRTDGQHSYSIQDYSAPPPRYEAELDDDMMVVDGFGYTPSNTDTTPESSIVDFSPRMSCDTQDTSTAKSERMD